MSHGTNEQIEIDAVARQVSSDPTSQQIGFDFEVEKTTVALPPGVVRLWGGERTWCVWLCYTGFLILAMLVPIDGIQNTSFYSVMSTSWTDKAVHMILFSTLTGLSGCVFFPFCKDPATTIDNITPERLGLLTAVVWGLGVGLESIQPLFGRTFEWLDMLTNISAIVPGIGLFLALNELRHILANLGTQR